MQNHGARWLEYEHVWQEADFISVKKDGEAQCCLSAAPPPLPNLSE